MNEELKKKYDEMQIETLEKMVESDHRLSREAQKEMIEVLAYLRTSGRWKENKRYAKESFWVYIEDRFNMRQGTYREHETALVKFPSQMLEYGVGLVRKTMQLCGEKKAKEVFSELDKMRLEKPVNRAQIERVIQKNKDQKKALLHVHKDWRSLFERELKAHEATKAALKDAMDKIGELEEQNEKLRATAKKVVDIRRMLGQPEKVMTVS